MELEIDFIHFQFAAIKITIIIIMEFQLKFKESNHSIFNKKIKYFCLVLKD